MPDIIAPSPTSQGGLKRHFGRLKRIDEKSLDYPIRANRLNLWRSLTARLRTKVNHRVWWQGNQGSTAQCTAYATLHAWEAGNGHARGEGKTLHGYPRPIVTPERIYDRAQLLDPWPGSEKVQPFYEGSSLTAAAKAAHEAGLILGYDWEFEDIGVCERAIFFGPLGFGIDWYAGMMLDGSPKTRWEDAVVKVDGPFMGGHAVACVGYDKRRKGAEFEILNSWGRTWGVEGRCYIGRDDLASLLQQDGEAVMLRDAADEAVATAYNDRLWR